MMKTIRFFQLRIWFFVALTASLLMFAAFRMYGQTQLAPLVTDENPIPLSTKFGAAGQASINDAGDYAFIGNGQSAVFYRPAGASAATRVMQSGDEVPGFPGSRADFFIVNIKVNSSGLMAFQVDFYDSGGSGQGAIFTYDGSTLTKIVSGDQLVPGGGGVKFERGLALVGLNNNGDVAFTASLVPSGSLLPVQTTLFIAPNGLPPVRVAGLGDTMPGTAATLTSLTGLSLNNQGKTLFFGNLSSGNGLFVGDTTSIQKIAATGDPKPEGGTFGTITSRAFLNNSGEVAFQATNVYLNQTSGMTAVALVGGAASPDVGGFYGANMLLWAFGDQTDLAFTANVTSSVVTSGALFRFRAASGVSAVAYRGQSAPGGGGLTYFNFNTVSVNAVGTVAFKGILNSSSTIWGVYRQLLGQSPTKVIMDGEPTPGSLGGTINVGGNFGASVKVLNNDELYFWGDIVDSPANYAEFLSNGSGATVLSSTADILPPGARHNYRTFKLGASGNFVGFLGQYSGGARNIVVHEITNHQTTVLVSDGDILPGTGGGRVWITTQNSVLINSNGKVAFSGLISGGPNSGSTAIFTADRTNGITKVAVNGDIELSTGRPFDTIFMTGFQPSPINDSGQVVFYATLRGGPATRAIMRWTPGVGVEKIAAVGDLTSAGTTISNFPAQSMVGDLSINNAGTALFRATVVGGSPTVFGIYQGSPGTTPAKIVDAGDAGPGGATFSAISQPMMNSFGEVAFMAQLTGGGGGAFIGTPSGAPSPIALHGNAAPSGGTYSFTVARPDIQINDNHDIVFRAEISGGPGSSAYFIRHTAAGAIQTAVIKGQVAPDSSGTFDDMRPSVNGFPFDNFQLGPDGSFAFQTFYLEGGRRIFGSWRANSNGSLDSIVVRGQIAPEFGGGSAVVSTGSAVWNSAGRFPVWARLTGSNYSNGIFLSVPVVGTNTPAGTDVLVTPIDNTTLTMPVSMLFSNVNQAGQTTVTTSSGSPVVPSAFGLGDPPVFYNIETTAVYSGTITVCLDYSWMTLPPGANIRLLHYENGVWTDVTTGGPGGSVVCGIVSSLSPFGVVYSFDNTPPSISVTANPSVLWAPNGAIIPITATVQVSDDFDPNPRVELYSITCNENLTPDDIQNAAFGTDDREFNLRATRFGNQQGRIYTVTYKATDSSGNVSFSSIQIVVPHDRRK